MLIFLVTIVHYCQAQEPYTVYDSLAIDWHAYGANQMMTCQNDTCYSWNINSNRRVVRVPSRRVENSYSCGYVNADMKVVIPLLYDDVGDFQDGIGIVTLFTPTRVSWHIKTDGQPLYASSKRYCKVMPFHNGYAIVYLDYSCHQAHINKNGDRIYPQTYFWVYDFNASGRAVVIKKIPLDRTEALYVVIDTTGKEILSSWGEYGEFPFPFPIEEYMK